MERLDIFLVKNGFAESRERAKKMIEGSLVSVNGVICLKASRKIAETDRVEAQGLRYVGRGAYKLLGAFEGFGLDVKDKICADIGASTGGFTQVLLERGAKRVYAVDVGHAQLAKRLADDDRVINLEGINARELKKTLFDEHVVFICCDLSFISLRLTLPPMADLLENGGELAILIKPQFEAGRDALNKNGIVKDRAKHIEVLNAMIKLFENLQLSLCGLIPSPITGGDGNIEYLAYLKKDGGAGSLQIDIKSVVNAAFERR